MTNSENRLVFASENIRIPAEGGAPRRLSNPPPHAAMVKGVSQELGLAKLTTKPKRQNR